MVFEEAFKETASGTAIGKEKRGLLGAGLV